MGSYKKIGLSHEMGLIDTPPLLSNIQILTRDVPGNSKMPTSIVFEIPCRLLIGNLS